MLRDGLYSAYTWRVRQFREGDPNETTLRFTPDGKPYGFVEQLKEDAPGAALSSRRRAPARRDGRPRELAGRISTPMPSSNRGRNGARVAGSITRSRTSGPRRRSNEGRYRLRLVESGDRLTEVTYFVRIPEAFTRRYQNMRSANEAIGIGSVVGMVLLYVVGGIGIGLFYMLRSRWVLWRRAATLGHGGRPRAGARDRERVAADVDDVRHGAPARRRSSPSRSRRSSRCSWASPRSSRSRSWRPKRSRAARSASHPQFWRVWSKGPGSSTAILGRTAAGYLLVAVFFAYDVLLYCHRHARCSAGGRRPRRCCTPTCSPPTCRGCRRSPTHSRPGSGKSACSARCRSRAQRSSATRFGQRAALHRHRVRRPGASVRRGARALPDPAVLRAAGRADHPVDRLRLALRVLRPAPGYRPALHLRRRLVRAADLPRRRRPASGSRR